MKENWKSRLKRDVIETTVKEEMIWLYLAGVVVEMGWRSPVTNGRSAAKPGLKTLGNMVTGPLAIAPVVLVPAGSKIPSTEPPDATLEACDAPKCSRVIDSPEQGTGTRNFRMRLEGTTTKKGTVHRGNSTELVT
jgi:hypothetical protein